jgi:hypothetical protein
MAGQDRSKAVGYEVGWPGRECPLLAENGLDAGFGHAWGLASGGFRLRGQAVRLIEVTCPSFRREAEQAAGRLVLEDP